MTNDNFRIGQEVFARFTNSGRIYQFRGTIVGKTKNYWKVEAIVSPYPDEKPGRIFHIATLASRQYSANNCLTEGIHDGARPDRD